MWQNQARNGEDETPDVGRNNKRPGRKWIFFAPACCLLAVFLAATLINQKAWKTIKIKDIKDTYLVAQLGDGGIQPGGTTDQVKNLRAAAHANASELDGERVMIEGLMFQDDLVYEPCSKGERASIAIRPSPRFGTPNRFFGLFGRFLPTPTASPVVKSGEPARVYGIYHAMGLEPTGDMQWCDWVEVEKLRIWDTTKGRWRDVKVMPKVKK